MIYLDQKHLEQYTGLGLGTILKMKIFILLCVFIIEYGCLVESQRFVEVGERVPLSCPQAFTWNNWISYDPVSSEPEIVLSWDAEIENFTLKYPQKHEIWLWPGGGRADLHIISAEVSDSRVWSCESSGYESKIELSVNVNDNSDLVNRVVMYNDPLRLAYHKELSENGIVQWLLESQDGSVNMFYYGKQSTGGLLEPYQNLWDESEAGHGVQTTLFGPYTTGNYRYVVIDGQEFETGTFSVTGAGDIGCLKAETLVKDRPETHNCSTIVTDGDFVPVFTLLRNGRPVQGQTIANPTTTITGRIWTFVYSFTPDFDDVNVPFTCHLAFRYEGSASQDVDTNFERSCTVQYDEIVVPGKADHV